MKKIDTTMASETETMTIFSVASWIPTLQVPLLKLRLLDSQKQHLLADTFSAVSEPIYH